MIFKIVIFSVIVCLFTGVLKENFKPVAVILTVCGCLSLFMIFTHIFSGIKDNIDILDDIEGVSADGVSIILKTLMVAYLTSFGSDICTDAGEKAIANALEIVGKAIMLSMALPMLMGIFKSVKEIIGG